MSLTTLPNDTSSPTNALLLVLLFAQREQTSCCSTCGYMLKQQGGGITAAGRAQVVDWLVDAAWQLGLSTDSLFLGVACLDKYLSLQPLNMCLLKLAAAACLWIASKYEQMVVPSVTCFAKVLGGTADYQSWTKEQLLAMEAHVLKTLDYRISSIPTTKMFLHCIMHRLGQLSQIDSHIYFLSAYLAELTLLEYQLLPTLPSKLAAAAYTFSHVLLGKPLDQGILFDITGYVLDDIEEAIQWICCLHAAMGDAAKVQPYSISLKYMSPSLGSVAVVPGIRTNDDDRLKQQC
eukprot:jgi/Chrzof1/5651/Cz16g10080.t1